MTEDRQSSETIVSAPRSRLLALCFPARVVKRLLQLNSSHPAFCWLCCRSYFPSDAPSVVLASHISPGCDCLASQTGRTCPIQSRLPSRVVPSSLGRIFPTRSSLPRWVVSSLLSRTFLTSSGSYLPCHIQAIAPAVHFNRQPLLPSAVVSRAFLIVLHRLCLLCLCKWVVPSSVNRAFLVDKPRSLLPGMQCSVAPFLL